MQRDQILERLRKKIASGKPILGAGAGTGISGKMEEVGGIDLIVIYNSGRFRMAGRGSLAGLMPYGDANGIVMEMAREVIPVVQRTPVLAGVCATDPFRVMSRFLREVQDAGFVGVQNFPTVGLIDGTFRQCLEETGMGFGLEVEMIRKAHEMGLLTTPYAFDPDQAQAMAEAGADILIAHMGLTAKGTVGAQSAMSLEEAVRRVQGIHDAAKRINPDILVLCVRLPTRPTPNTSSTTQKGSSAFTGPAAWNDCRSSPPSPTGSASLASSALPPQRVDPPSPDLFLQAHLADMLRRLGGQRVRFSGRPEQCRRPIQKRPTRPSPSRFSAMALPAQQSLTRTESLAF